ncbi:MAG: hypothetical protein KC877_01120 [Candidatus Kaiserbacteria bacterium]|nr:hypothetical protein [Candidatus Kaiserbacteria bacterium]MCB9816504.1 hypothetical protein [Candidatus Nomurabacteria bacterium]
MKRPILIIIGAILVFILLAVWVYILFFGKPSGGDDTFNNLNFGDTTDTTVVTPQPTTETPVVDVTGPERLRQLTTEPTAGFQIVQQDASSTPMVYYIEAGTGHIFTISLADGEEERISGTTIPGARTAAMTPNGKHVIVQSGTTGEVIIGSFSTSSNGLQNVGLEGMVTSFAATINNTFLYATKVSSGVQTYEYDPISHTSAQLFTIPFREAAIKWGETADSVHYVYPKASSQLEGLVYEVRNGKVTRLPIDGYGLTAYGNGSAVIVSKLFGGKTYQSYLYTPQTGLKNLPITTLTEKCTSYHTHSSFVCAAGTTQLDATLPDNWYKGVTTFADDLWKITPSLNSAERISSIRSESGRELDITTLVVSMSDDILLFLNKKDQTLWLFELPENVSFETTLPESLPTN